MSAQRDVNIKPELISQSLARRPVIPTTRREKKEAIASHDSRYIFGTYLPNRFPQRVYIDITSDPKRRLPATFASCSQPAIRACIHVLAGKST